MLSSSTQQRVEWMDILCRGEIGFRLYVVKVMATFVHRGFYSARYKALFLYSLSVDFVSLVFPHLKQTRTFILT